MPSRFVWTVWSVVCCQCFCVFAGFPYKTSTNKHHAFFAWKSAGGLIRQSARSFPLVQMIEHQTGIERIATHGWVLCRGPSKWVVLLLLAF